VAYFSVVFRYLSASIKKPTNVSQEKRRTSRDSDKVVTVYKLAAITIRPLPSIIVAFVGGSNMSLA
jgi:hypothetical protein